MSVDDGTPEAQQVLQANLDGCTAALREAVKQLGEEQGERQRWEDQANGQLDRAQRAEREAEHAYANARRSNERKRAAESALAEAQETLLRIVGPPWPSSVAEVVLIARAFLAARPGPGKPHDTSDTKFFHPPHLPKMSVDNGSSYNEELLSDKLEVAHDALLDILDITTNWTRRMNAAERLNLIEKIAQKGLGK